MVVGLQQHQVLPCVSIPDEDMAAVRAAHHKIISPETRLLDLHAQPEQQREMSVNGSLQNTLHCIRITN